MSKSITTNSSNQNRKCEHFPYEIIIFVGAEENPVQLRDTTLLLCKMYRIPPNKITILLAEKGQESKYNNTLLPGSFGKILVSKTLNDIIPIGSPFICMNSCITGFFEYDPVNNTKKPLRSLLGLIKHGFTECQKQGAFLWSIKKNMHLKNTISNGLKRITGAFYGSVYMGIDSDLPVDEEIERTILYYKKTKSVLCLNMYGVSSCKISGTSGVESRKLLKKYPEYIVLIKKDNVYILKLKDGGGG
jgi:hypothetical protein